VAETVLVEKGEDPSVLVVAFTGFKGGLTMPTFDFLALTKLTRYSRILLLDISRTCYMGGVPPELPDYAALREALRAHIAQLAPQKTIFIGASSGAYAALLLGHELAADYVHAFSPYTYLDRGNVLKHDDQDSLANQADTIARIEALPADVRPLLDLAPILTKHNSKSRYYLHVCRDSSYDMMRAKRLIKCQGVLLIGYPCAGHGVAATLARNNLLGDLLKLENQEHLARKLKERIQ
jgi:hypothetical protein